MLKVGLIFLAALLSFSFSFNEEGKRITANYYFDTARIDISRNDFKSAEKNLKKALRIFPNHEDATVELGLVYLWTKRAKKAIPLFEKFPKNDEAQRGLAKAYIEEKRGKDAIQILKNLHQNYPEDLNINKDLSAAFLLTATEKIKNAEIEEASKDLNLALDAYPQNDEAWIRLGYIYLWQNELEKAYAIFERFPNDRDAIDGLQKIEERKVFEKEVQKRGEISQEFYHDLFKEKKKEYLEESLKQDPHSSDLQLQLGREYLKEKKWNLAYKIFKQSPDPEFKKGLAASIAGMGDLKEARCLFLQLPPDEEVSKSLSRIYYRLAMQDLCSAILYLSCALHYDPLYEDAFLQLKILKQEATDASKEKLARLAVERKDFNTASRLYADLTTENFEKHKEDYVSYLYHLGIYFRDKKEYTLSEESFLKALQIDPRHVDSDVQLANVYVDQKKWECAERIYLKYPKYIESMKGYARLLRNTSRLCQAIDLNLELFLEYPHDIEAVEGYAEDFYSLGKWYREQKWEALSEKTLREALLLNPKHVDAQILLASILIGKKEFFEAFVLLQRNLKELDAQKAMARLYLEQENLELAEAWYCKLWREHPCDREVIDGVGALFYSKGLFSYKRRSFWRAKNELEYSLQLKPNNSDAEILLGNTYLVFDWKRKAYARFIKHPKNPDAIEGLGRIALMCERWCEALQRYRYLINKRSDDPDIGLGYARSLNACLYYCAAERAYQRLLCGVNGEIASKEIFEVKRHTHVATAFDFSYTDAIENDPTLGIPAALDQYLNTYLTGYFPLRENWRLDSSLYYGFQKEDNLVPPRRLNYDAGLAALRMISRNWLSNEFSWNASLNLKRAWDEAKRSNFPFINTTRVEPGIGFLHQRLFSRFAANAYRDSFVIKNFRKRKSMLLGVNHVDVDLLARSKKGEIEGWFEARMYEDGNFRDEETVWLRSYLPCTRNLVRIYLEVLHARFKKLTPNYFTYKEQWWPKIGFVYFNEWNYRTSLELLCEHGWQINDQVFLPVGSLVFVSPYQKWLTDRFEATLIHRVCEKWRLELGGRYFHTTLPYHDWRVRGGITYVF